jgi:UDP-N-acetylglucosamine--N-acetylmuramyl-(pentapeptide) pyrophosphoryl-undecaprenol N-acetylglucosamine transferase
LRSQKTILVMAGGTGGHVFPALAVAARLKEQGNRVYWLGTRHGLEKNIVPNAGFPISYISIKGLRGKGLLGWLLAPARLSIAIVQGMRICMQIKPDVILGMGGFVTGPGGIAARLMGKPLVIHEQNAIAGMTNRWLAKIATRVLQAFPNTFAASKKSIHTGNPVRQSILELDDPQQRMQGRTGAIRILIVGGSLGAQALNECVPQAIAMLDTTGLPEVWHQTGKQKLDSTQQRYEQLNVKARLSEFVDDMDVAYAWADLIICRAGAMTVSEISNVGLASILVPYPYAVDDHQTANASYLSNAGAAILIQQVDLTPERLAAELKQLISAGREKLLQMANSALATAKPAATSDVARLCMEVAR